MPYSPFFQTLHDEKQAVGSLGRGTHYSVLRAVTWHNALLRPFKSGAAFLDFAVVWDEDHDTRVIDVIHAIYLAGLLPPVKFVGERKGGLTLLLESANWEANALDQYHRELVEVVKNADIGDSWDVTIEDVSSTKHGLISASDYDVNIYLRNIEVLWDVGIKDTKGHPRVHLQLNSQDYTLCGVVRPKDAILRVTDAEFNDSPRRRPIPAGRDACSECLASWES